MLIFYGLQIDNIDTSNVENMEGMFCGVTELKSLDLSHFDVSKVKDMSYMFYGFGRTSGYTSNTSKLENINFTGWNTQNLEKMDAMFYNCRSLNSLNINHFDVSNVKSMIGTFTECYNISSIDISNWRNNRIEYMVETFYGLGNYVGGIKKIDLSGFDLSNIKRYEYDMEKEKERRKSRNVEGIELGGFPINICLGTTKIEEIYLPYNMPTFNWQTQHENWVQEYDENNEWIGEHWDGTYIIVDHNYDGRMVIGNKKYVNADDPSDNTIYTGTTTAATSSKSIHLVLGDKITLNTNGGTINEGELKRYKLGEEVNLPTDITKEHYNFKGWYKEADFSGEEITKIETTDTGELTFYAKWEPKEYTITYNLEGGSIAGEKAKYTIEDDDFALVEPTKQDTFFLGWIGEGITEPKKEVEIKKGSYGDKEYTAVWANDVLKTISIDRTSLADRFKTPLEQVLSNSPINYTITTEKGKTFTKALTKDMVKGYDQNSFAEIQNLTILYEDMDSTSDTYKQQLSTTITFQGIDFVEDIEITKPIKLLYNIGESIDLIGGKIKPIMASGRSQEEILLDDGKVLISGFDSSSEGAKNITVEYSGCTKTYGIVVQDLLSSITFTKLPTKTDYKYNEELDITGGKITIRKESGEEEVIDITQEMVSGYNKNKLGSQTLDISYEGERVEYIVNVEDYITGIKAVNPDKTTYNKGEDLNLTGGKVVVLKASGEKEELTLTSSMISEYDANKEGNQDVKVSYKGFDGEFNVKVIVQSSDENKDNNNADNNKNDNGEDNNKNDNIDNNNKDDSNKNENNNKNNEGDNSNRKYNDENNGNNNSNNDENNNKTNQQKNNDSKNIKEEEKESSAQKENSNTESKSNNSNLILNEREKDFFKDNVFSIVGITVVGLIIAFSIIGMFRKNIDIYVEQNGVVKNHIRAKITKNNLMIDLDQGDNNYTIGSKVNIYLNKKISKKLSKKSVIVKINETHTEHIIRYNGNPFKIEI